MYALGVPECGRRGSNSRRDSPIVQLVMERYTDAESGGPHYREILLAAAVVDGGPTLFKLLRHYI